MDCTVRKKDRRLERAKARTKAVRRGEKIQFDGFYLGGSGATFHDAKTGKIILRTFSTNVP